MGLHSYIIEIAPGVLADGDTTCTAIEWKITVDIGFEWSFNEETIVKHNGELEYLYWRDFWELQTLMDTVFVSENPGVPLSDMNGGFVRVTPGVLDTLEQRWDALCDAARKDGRGWTAEAHPKSCIQDMRSMLAQDRALVFYGFW